MGTGQGSVLQKLMFVTPLTDCSNITKVMFIKDNLVVMHANRRTPGSWELLLLVDKAMTMAHIMLALQDLPQY